MLLGDASAFMPRDNLGIAASRTTGVADSGRLTFIKDIFRAMEDRGCKEIQACFHHYIETLRLFGGGR
jgi:hypothetical protein